MKYAVPSWSGFTTRQQLQQLQSLINKLIRLQYLPSSYPNITNIFSTLDSRLFNKIESNTNHVMHHLLPSIKTHIHNLRQRKHKYDITTYSTLQNKTFIRTGRSFYLNKIKSDQSFFGYSVQLYLI